MDPSVEQQLLAQAQRGDQQAYGTLVSRYQQSLFAVCYRLLGQRQDAENATQEAFVRGFRSLAGFDRRGRERLCPTLHPAGGRPGQPDRLARLAG